MSGPESQTLMATWPGSTVIVPLTVPVSLTVLKMLTLRLKENGSFSRIWSLTATITVPSEIGESKTRLSVAVVTPGLTGGGGGGATGRWWTVTGSAVGTAFFTATFSAFFFFSAAAAAS